MKIGVYFKDELSESELSTLLITKINEYGFEFDNENPDVLIYVGGDGTLLRAINQQIDKLPLDTSVCRPTNQSRWCL